MHVGIMYICMYVCLYAFMPACMHVCMHVCVCMYVNVCNVCTYARKYLPTCLLPTYVHIHICKYVSACTRVINRYKHMYIDTHVHLHGHIWLMYILVCTYFLNVQACIYVYRSVPSLIRARTPTCGEMHML